MTIADRIRLLSNRLASLNEQKATAEARGDIERAAAIEADVLETDATLSALRAL